MSVHYNDQGDDDHDQEHYSEDLSGIIYFILIHDDFVFFDYDLFFYDIHIFFDFRSHVFDHVDDCKGEAVH
jgi:hypothetical protein